jgi:hypothetical protein
MLAGATNSGSTGRSFERRGRATRAAPTDGIQAAEPGAEIERLMGLLANIGDSDYVTRHIDFTNWFEMDAGPAGAFLPLDHRASVRPQRAGARRTSRRRRPVNLSAIDCPIYLLAGTKDHITPPEQVWALADLYRLQPNTFARAGRCGTPRLVHGSCALRSTGTPIARAYAGPLRAGRLIAHAKLGRELPRQTAARNRQGARGGFQSPAEIPDGEFDGSRNATPAVEDRHRDGRLAALEFIPGRGDLRQPDDRQFLA